MSRVGFVFLVVTQILVLEALALNSEAPMTMELETQREAHLSYEKTEELVANHAVAGGSASQEEAEKSKAEAEEVAEAPHVRRMGKHHSTDKSVAGGGVIIGGLVTATFAAVFCYIRVTRKRDSGK